MRALIPIVDIVTPNEYESSPLTNMSLNDTADAFPAVHMRQARGQVIVLLTSFCGRDPAIDKIDAISAGGATAWRLRTAKLKFEFSGSGDLRARVFLQFLLTSWDSGSAMVSACQIVFTIVREIMKSEPDDLMPLEAGSFLQLRQVCFATERLN